MALDEGYVGAPLSAPMDDNYFKDRFNTPLTPQDEAMFQQQLAKSGQAEDLYNYDLRGAWQENPKVLDRKSGEHGTDTYKKPNHDTFSDQSQYHGAVSPWGKYEGGSWSKNDTVYTPSANMLRNTHSLSTMMDYMQKYEPDVKLNLRNTK